MVPPAASRAAPVARRDAGAVSVRTRTGDASGDRQAAGRPDPVRTPRSPPRGNRTWTKGRSSPGSMLCSTATSVTSGVGSPGRTPSPRSSRPSSASAAAPRRSARTGSSTPTPTPPCPPCWSWPIHRLRSVEDGDAPPTPGSWSLLRGTGHRLGLLTNGIQFRLIYAGLDFESWCEWESDRWFDDGEGTEELAGLRQLLSPDSLKPVKEGVSGLLDAVEESRKRQADLSERAARECPSSRRIPAGRRVDGEPDELEPVHAPGPSRRTIAADRRPGPRSAATKRRCGWSCGWSSACSPSPGNCCRSTTRSTPSAYGVRSLYELLEEAVRTEGGVHVLFNRQTAWPRLMALFRLIHDGSAPRRRFRCEPTAVLLFRPGDADEFRSRRPCPAHPGTRCLGQRCHDPRRPPQAAAGPAAGDPRTARRPSWRDRSITPTSAPSSSG